MTLRWKKKGYVQRLFVTAVYRISNRCSIVLHVKSFERDDKSRCTGSIITVL